MSAVRHGWALGSCICLAPSVAMAKPQVTSRTRLLGTVTLVVALSCWVSRASGQGPCQRNPCENGGTCVVVLDEAGLDEGSGGEPDTSRLTFVCNCDEGFSGMQCERRDALNFDGFRISYEGANNGAEQGRRPENAFHLDDRLNYSRPASLGNCSQQCGRDCAGFYWFVEPGQDASCVTLFRVSARTVPTFLPGYTFINTVHSPDGLSTTSSSSPTSTEQSPTSSQVWAKSLHHRQDAPLCPMPAATQY